MIGYIVGIDEGSLVIEVNSIGYHIYASNSTLSKLKVGQEAKIHTVLQLKENDISIIGFLSQEDVKIFSLLTSVSGVGAKVALAIQNVLDASRIMLAILTEEVDELSRAQGVGKKLASRIVLELRDKLKNSEISQDIVAPQQNIASGNAEAKQEATEALVALGYTKNEAIRAIMEVALPEMTTDQIIRQSLRKLV